MEKITAVVAFLTALSIAGCSTLTVDPSIEDSGDFTLAVSACEAVPGGGMDVCRVREGTEISSSWRLIVPSSGENVLGGEVDVYYRDVHRSFPISGTVIEIPWRAFFGSGKWSREMDGEALALVLVRYKTPEGAEEQAKFRGIAKIVVTKPGYDRLPIDSGYGTWRTKCEIVYSTAGRGAVKCR